MDKKDLSVDSKVIIKKPGKHFDMTGVIVESQMFGVYVKILGVVYYYEYPSIEEVEEVEEQEIPKTTINIGIEIEYSNEEELDYILAIIKKQIVDGYVSGRDGNDTSNYYYTATRSN
jgi:hypothetical protein